MAGDDAVDRDLEAARERDEETDTIKPELMGPVRRFRFPRRTSTGLSFSSRKSAHSIVSKPIEMYRRISTASRQGTGLSQAEAAEVPREFVSFLSADQTRTASYRDSCNWFVIFIDAMYEDAWPLILSIVVFKKEASSPPTDKDFAVVDHVLKVMAQLLWRKRDCALADIEDELINQELVIEGLDERAALHHLVFIFVGWLSMLYEPKLDSKPQELEINRLALKTSGDPTRYKSRIFDAFTQDFERVDHALYLLLGRFGKLIPEPTLRSPAVIAPPSEWITAPYVSYHTLRKVCGIEIEWVGTLGMHLEFDSGRKVLKVFRFPSFCRLMYRYKQKGLLSQLFHDNTYDLLGEVTTETATTSDYFRELLLTYRLIFSQDTSSHRLFAAETMPRSAAQRRPYPRSGPSSASATAPPSQSRPSKPSIHNLPTSDPLLPLLCSHSPTFPLLANFYDEIAAPPQQPYYMPSSFPFFAKRIMVLQSYVREQNPHDLKTLWYDNRNKSNWWQFWAVLFIGGGTLILGTLALVFQIWQVVLTQQALDQGVSPSPAGGGSAS